MKNRTALRAGMTLAECTAQRDLWKQRVRSGKCDAPLPGPWNPGGGWVGGRWIKDRIGVCA